MERRAYPRVTVSIHAEIEIEARGRGEGCPFEGRSICCVVNSIDIGLGGFSARIANSPLDTNRSFSPALAYRLVGREISAYFTGQEVTVRGKVVRVDPESMLMAVVINRVSDIGRWREVCSQAIMDQIAR